MSVPSEKRHPRVNREDQLETKLLARMNAFVVDIWRRAHPSLRREILDMFAILDVAAEDAWIEGVRDGRENGYEDACVDAHKALSLARTAYQNLDDGELHVVRGCLVQLRKLMGESSPCCSVALELRGETDGTRYYVCSKCEEVP